MNARLVFAGLALALAAPTAPGVPGMPGASAPSPVRTQPLAPGEVLLETGGVSLVSTRADVATLTISVNAGGATMTEAGQEADARARRIVEALRRAGVPAEAIATRSGPSGIMTFDVMDNMTMAMTENAMSSDAHNAVRTLRVRLTNLDRIEAVRAAADAAGPDEISGPVYSLADNGPARRRARVEALAAARADAEAQAASMNMRVARIVRITERVGMDMYSLLLGLAPRFQGVGTDLSEERTDPDIPTLAIVGVDFALAPR